LRIFDATVHLRPARPGPFTVESGFADHVAGRIPGAAFIDLPTALSDPTSPLRFTLPPLAQLEAALSAHGLRNDDDCVVYSTTSPMWATRLWWMLGALGFGARVLDGGFVKWRAEGRPVATGAESYPAGDFRAAAQPGRWADRDEVLRSIGRASVCTINALSASLHAGTAEVHYGRRGHIQGSVNLPYSALVRPDGSFRPVDELREALAAVGALDAARVICYCGGGIAATMDALALQLVGHPDVAVYDGSLSEWVLDPALPMAMAAGG
jgi:thiosulfate/3-mercaptopyruvate sulfurtransferase